MRIGIGSDTHRLIEGRKLTFHITASDEQGLIGEGEHVRYIVNTDKFMSKLNHGIK